MTPETEAGRKMVDVIAMIARGSSWTMEEDEAERRVLAIERQAKRLAVADDLASLLAIRDAAIEVDRTWMGRPPRSVATRSLIGRWKAEKNRAQANLHAVLMRANRT